MDRDSSLPTFSVDLVKDLDKEYPHKCITLGIDLPHEYFYAGKRALIDYLLLRLNNTQNSVFQRGLGTIRME